MMVQDRIRLTPSLGFLFLSLDDEIEVIKNRLMIETFKDLIRFLSKNKKWWLLPILLFLLSLASLIVYSQGTVVAPFVYTLF